MVWPALDELIGAYSPNLQTPIAIGVSGGGDSLALMHKAADWAAARHRTIHILTVDHGLRPEARGEAERVSKAADALGLDHQILRWTRPIGQQAAARMARHRLLADAARRVGAETLLLGHTFDDVLETVLIRKRKNAPRTRLAGPTLTAPSPVWPEGRGLTLLRPLISERRADLRRWLHSQGFAWSEDPSNENTRFERVRVRQFLTRHPRLEQTVAEISNQLVAERERQDRRLGQALANTALIDVDASGLIAVRADTLPQALVCQLLAILLPIAGGHDRRPRFHKVQDLVAESLQAGGRRTLAGAWVQTSKTGFLIGRDPGEPSIGTQAGLWDGRFERAPAARLPDSAPVLMRATHPPGSDWRPLIAERIQHQARAYQTLRVMPVQR